MKTLIRGKSGEDAACKLLKEKKYKILERNFRKKHGEIDIIAKKDDKIIFVEVKARSTSEFGTPAEFVTYAKQQRIIKTAWSYIQENSLDAEFAFDIIEVYLYNGKPTSFNHIENAFYA